MITLDAGVHEQVAVFLADLTVAAIGKVLVQGQG